MVSGQVTAHAVILANIYCSRVLLLWKRENTRFLKAFCSRSKAEQEKIKVSQVATFLEHSKVGHAVRALEWLKASVSSQED